MILLSNMTYHIFFPLIISIIFPNQHLYAGYAGYAGHAGLRRVFYAC